MGQRQISRREFLRTAAKFGVAVTATGLVLNDPQALLRLIGLSATDAEAASVLDAIVAQAPVARFWINERTPGVTCADCHTPAEIGDRTSHDHDGPVVRCLLCANNCLLKPGKRGRCHARMNVDGQLRTLVYGRPIATHIDPIEKKPFFNFLPGSQAFSLATSGCALHCLFCQNWEISQASPEDYQVDFTPPGRIVRSARAHKTPVIAFTYNEPTIFTEYLLDIARLGNEQGIRSVLISCGFMNEAPLREMCARLAAIKIDLKGFSEEFYRRISSAHLQPVLRSIKQVARSGTHLELVNLVIPTLNDQPDRIDGLITWVLDELGPDVPVHFTRFHPDFRLQNLPPTPVETLTRVWETARDAGLHYAYVGNVPGHPGNSTYCPGCGKVVIGRRGFFITEMHITDGRCAYCGAPIAGVWQ